MDGWRCRAGGAESSGYPGYGSSPGEGTACREVAAGCTGCGVCVQQCAFLQRHGSPKELAEAFLVDPGSWSRGFECSLCRLCDALCPEGVRPAGMFLEMRRAAVEAGIADLAPYRPLLRYERLGRSDLLSYFALPQGCNTVFFPGCTFSGTRAWAVSILFDHLRAIYPGLGIVLDCCGKPSHDLGLQQRFNSAFAELTDFLSAAGAARVVLACPNCYQVFKNYAPGLEAVTVYELLAEHGLPEAGRTEGGAALHDPCAVRFDTGVQEAVRRLFAHRGVRIREMRHRGERTLCCGEGGAVALRNPALAKRWRSKRWSEAQGCRMLTYCAGCAGFLGRKGRANHVVDLILRPKRTMKGRAHSPSAPFTYLHRWLLKRTFRRKLRPRRSGPRSRVLSSAGRHRGG